MLRRKIYITGPIDEASYLAFSKRLTVLEEQDEIEPIEIELYSFGGEAYSALAFAARMRNSRCHLVVRAHGLVASAAVIILAAGKHREMTKEAWVMVHEDAGEHEGSVTMLEGLAVHARRLELQWNQLLEELTGTTAKKWMDLHAATTYLNAKQCLRLGLIDRIV